MRTPSSRGFAVTIVLPAALVVTLDGCSSFQNEVEHQMVTGPGWNTPAAYTTADVRIVTQRNHPVLGNPVICTEPSPDVAKALSQIASLTAQGGTTGVSAGVGGSTGTAEALAEMGGRSTALLALRDGMYRACEAYANGIIGQDAYALVLSHYSQLMSTLFLGQDVASATAAPGAQISSPVLSPPPTAAPPPTTAAAATTTPAPTTKKTASNDTADGGRALASAPAIPVGVDKPMLVPAVWGGPRPGGSVPPLSLTLRASAVTPQAGGAAATPVATAAPDPTASAAPAPADDPNKPKAAVTPTKTPAPTTAAPATSAPAAAPSPAPAGSSAALALTRMNEDYMHEGILGTLMVACINNGDMTRMRTAASVYPLPVDGSGKVVPGNYDGRSNAWLDRVCGEMDFAVLQKIEGGIAQWQPVDPAAATGAAAKPAGAASQQTQPDPVVMAVQIALFNAKYDPKKIDGLSGPETVSALKAYQKHVGLPQNGNPKDPDTLLLLKVPVTEMVK